MKRSSTAVAQNNGLAHGVASLAVVWTPRFPKQAVDIEQALTLALDVVVAAFTLVIFSGGSDGQHATPVDAARL